MIDFPYYRYLDFFAFILLAATIGAFYLYSRTKNERYLSKAVALLLFFLALTYGFYLFGEYYIYYPYRSYVYQLGGFLDDYIRTLPYKITEALSEPEYKYENPILFILKNIGLASYLAIFTIVSINVGIVHRFFSGITDILTRRS